MTVLAPTSAVMLYSELMTGEKYKQEVLQLILLVVSKL